MPRELSSETSNTSKGVLNLKDALFLVGYKAYSPDCPGGDVCVCVFFARGVKPS